MKAIPTLLALAIALAACTPNMTAAGPLLTGTQWVLKAMPGWDMAKAPQVPTLFFQSATQAGGRSGCNTWGGAYVYKGGNLRFSEMRVTAMACAYGMDVERLYLDALEHARGVTVVDGTLILVSEGGAELARFFPASTAVPP